MDNDYGLLDMFHCFQGLPHNLNVYSWLQLVRLFCKQSILFDRTVAIERRSIAKLLVNKQSFWAQAYLCCFCRESNINIKWQNQSIPKGMVQCRRISESCRIFRPNTLIVVLCNSVVSWDDASCIICKSKGMSNSVKMGLRMRHTTWAVAFSEWSLQV